MEKLSENLAQNIAELRKKKGQSQEDLAYRIGVTRQIVSRWELGTSKPRTDKLESLSKEFGITMNQLLGKEELTPSETVQQITDEVKDKVQKENQDNKKQKRGKTIKVLAILLIVLVAIYVIYGIYKFIIIMDFNKKVAENNNLTNYYCKIKTYRNNVQQQEIQIWHKDNKYKVETYSYNNVGSEILHTIKWIDLENDTYAMYDYTMKSLKENIEVSSEDDLTEMASMYTYFPTIIRSNMQLILRKVFEINMCTIKWDQNSIQLKINKNIIQIDANAKLPILYLAQDNNNIIRKSYNIKVNYVTDNDVELNKESLQL